MIVQFYGVNNDDRKNFVYINSFEIIILFSVIRKK
jgi:hypothetical protein